MGRRHNFEPGQMCGFKQRLANLTNAGRACWRALGNVLLLIGGDDTVDINFNFNPDTTQLAVPVFSLADRQQ